MRWNRQSFEKTCRQATLEFAKKYSNVEGYQFVEIGSNNNDGWNCIVVHMAFEFQFPNVPDSIHLKGKDGYSYDVIVKKVESKLLAHSRSLPLPIIR